MCAKNFDTDSRIFELNQLEKTDTPQNRLVHVECATCQTCNSSIDALSEYTFEQKIDDHTGTLTCKCCAIKKLNPSRVDAKNKKVFSSNIRLSSRQKELLASKILTSNIELTKMLTEASEIVKYLSAEIKCSKKSLVYYLNKHIKKANEKQSELESVQLKSIFSANANKILKHNPLKMMLDELNRLDKILAPNRFPFGQLHARKNADVILAVSEQSQKTNTN